MADRLDELPLTDKILLFFFTLISVGEEILWETQPSRIYEALHGYDPELRRERFEKTSIGRTLYRFLERKILERYYANGRKKIRLSHQGIEYLFSHFPNLSRMNQKWDGRFRLVFYDLPDDLHNSRKRLREILKLSGFQPIQLSVWISPFRIKNELEEFLKKSHLTEHVWILEVSLPLSKGRELIKRFWGKVPALPQEVSMKKELYQKNPREFLNKLLINPFLPKELLK